MNVTGKERYAVIPDEIIRYALGKFGRPNVPIDPQVMDRIMSLPRTRELEAEPGMAPLSELRRRIGAGLSDEMFLLRATMPAELVDAMQAAGPAPREARPRASATAAGPAWSREASTSASGSSTRSAMAPDPRRTQRNGDRKRRKRGAPASAAMDRQGAFAPDAAPSQRAYFARSPTSDR